MGRKKTKKIRPKVAPPVRAFWDRLADVSRKIWIWLRSPWSRTATLFTAISVVCGIIATVSEFTNLLPNVTVTTSFRDKSNNPFSARYDVVNAGVVPLMDVEFGCFIDSTKFTRGSIDTKNVVAKQERRIHWFWRGEPYTTKCRTGFDLQSHTPESGVLNFIAWYKWFFIPRQKVWSLEYVESADNWVWRPGKEIDMSKQAVLNLRYEDK